jgi:hypothetical protein
MGPVELTPERAAGRQWTLRRVSAATCSLAILTAAGMVLGVPRALGDTQFTYDAVTSGSGFIVTLSNPSIPAGLTIEASGPVSQGHLSSLGQANGFASFPYPGDTVVGLPGLVNGLSGIPVPPYPLYVSSSYGAPPESTSYPGGLDLSSESAQNTTDSTATVGTASSGAQSRSLVRQTGDDVTAQSITVVNTLTVGPVMTIAGVSTTAKMVFTSDGKLTPSSSLSIADISVPALNLRLPSTVPAPLGGRSLLAAHLAFSNGQFTVTVPTGQSASVPVPTDAVIAGLQQAGIKTTYQNAIVTKTSVVAPQLTFATTLPSPPNNQLYNGRTPVTYTFGVASASFGAAVAEPSNGGISTPLGGTGDGSGLTGGTGTTGGTLTSGSVGLVSGSGGLNAAPSVGPRLLPPPVKPALPTTTRQAAVFGALWPSLFWFYLVIVAVAICGTVGSQALRYLGVRSTWSS